MGVNRVINSALSAHGRTFTALLQQHFYGSGLDMALTHKNPGWDPFRTDHETPLSQEFPRSERTCFPNSFVSELQNPGHLNSVILKPVGRIFEISDSKPIQGKCGKCGRPSHTRKNKGLRRFRRTKTRKTRKMRKMRKRKRGKCGKCG